MRKKSPKPRSPSKSSKALVNFKDVDTWEWVVKTAFKNSSPLREIIERACTYAMQSKDFSVPQRVRTWDKIRIKQVEAEKRRKDRYLRRA